MGPVPASRTLGLDAHLRRRNARLGPEWSTPQVGRARVSRPDLGPLNRGIPAYQPDVWHMVHPWVGSPIPMLTILPWASMATEGVWQRGPAGLPWKIRQTTTDTCQLETANVPTAMPRRCACDQPADLSTENRSTACTHRESQPRRHHRTYPDVRDVPHTPPPRWNILAIFITKTLDGADEMDVVCHAPSG